MIKKLWRAIWAFFHPAQPLTKEQAYQGNCKVKLTRGWTKATIFKKNVLTCWVQLWSGDIIKRRNRQVEI